MTGPGIEPQTFRSEVQHADHYTTTNWTKALALTSHQEHLDKGFTIIR